MADRRGSRFVAEALFLVALAVALTLARLDALEIAGAMLLGWVVVAALEWAAWRAEPHFGSGLPPRYYVPAVKLPPPQPLEQVDQGYPESGRDDAPTWIATASLRAEVLGEWPVFGPVQHEPDEDEEDEEPQFVAPAADADPWTVAALPAAPVEQREPAVRVTMRSDGRLARYSLDPLGEAPRRRRLGRNSGSETIEVPARPRERALPSTVSPG